MPTDGECLLLAKNGSSGGSNRLPLFPQLQTFLWSSLTSVVDPKATQDHAAKATATPADRKPRLHAIKDNS